MLCGAVDGGWMQATYGEWRAHLREIMVEAQITRLAAAEEEEEQAGGGEGGAQQDEAEAEAQQQQAAADGGGAEGQEQEPASEGGEGGDGGGGGSPVEDLLAYAAGWCMAQACVTTGTMTILRQVQRVCLEAAIPALLAAILDCARHTPDEYISDVDLMTVYLEQARWARWARRARTSDVGVCI
ncbi:MAG: hypothetical protein J3K34DRAFT_178484 [Monoraphidium minutum]|nr:MAG: hypothetical protein J3K34DRAFT_178484 [Monoraphidium minutum]